jgi:hypothetical protein
LLFATAIERRTMRTVTGGGADAAGAVVVDRAAVSSSSASSTLNTVALLIDSMSSIVRFGELSVTARSSAE